MKKVIKVSLVGDIGHYKMANTNHSLKMTYAIPPRTSLLGMLGAICGLKYDEAIDKFNDCVDFGWKWNVDIKKQIITLNRHKIQKGAMFDKNKTFFQTLDVAEYITPKKDKFLKAEWFIFVNDDNLFDYILESLKNPVYAIYFGTTDCLAGIINYEIVNGEFIKDTVEAQYIVSDNIIKHGICETVQRKMLDQRVGIEFVKVWWGVNDMIEGVNKFGAYKINDDYIPIL